MNYKEYVKKISVNADKKIKQKSYLISGELPVIDQGAFLIGGYTNDYSKEIVCILPVIVFGDHTKKVKYVNFPFAAGADGIKVLQAKEGVSTKYLFYATQYLTHIIPDKGYARHYQFLEKCELDVPVQPEQERIVQKMEELFASLDKGVEDLEQAKARLKVYRQAVLKEAFSENEHLKLSILFDCIIEKPRNGYSPKAVTYETKYKNLTLTATTSGIFKGENFKYVDLDIQENSYLWLKKNDILIQRANTIDYVGASAIYDGDDYEYVYPDLMMKVQAKDDFLPKFILYQLQSEKVRTYFRDNATGTAGNMPKINQKTVMNAPIFSADKNTQSSIMEKIEMQLSTCDKQEEIINESLQKAENLRQSILKQAFEGRLV